MQLFQLQSPLWMQISHCRCHQTKLGVQRKSSHPKFGMQKQPQPFQVHKWWCLSPQRQICNKLFHPAEFQTSRRGIQYCQQAQLQSHQSWYFVHTRHQWKGTNWGPVCSRPHEVCHEPDAPSWKPATSAVRNRCQPPGCMHVQPGVWALNFPAYHASNYWQSPIVLARQGLPVSLACLRKSPNQC